MPKPDVIIIRNANAYDFGGGERFPIFLAQELQRHAFRPIVWSRSEKVLGFAEKMGLMHKKSWWWSNQNWSGTRALLFPVYMLWQVIMTVYYLIWFAHLKPRVVHIQSKDDFISATFAAKLTGVRVIWTDHADLKHIWLNVAKPLKNPVGKLVLLAATLTDYITIVSQSELNQVNGNITWKRVIKKLTVVYNGALDMPDLVNKKGSNTEITFCYAGRLVYDKGINELINAFEISSSRMKHSRLVVIGDGKLYNELSARNYVSNIEFTGHLSDPLPIMSKCDVFVHPTHHEGFSVALVEANMLGLAIISTNVGGNPEIITNEKNGLLVESDDVSALSAAMFRIYNDNELLRSLSENAREVYVKEFNFSNIVTEKFIPLYRGVSHEKTTDRN